MAWVRPTRPWPGQKGVAAGNSCGGGGSSLPSGGPAALGGGGQELGRDEGERPHPTAPWPGLSIPTAKCQSVEHAGIGGEAFSDEAQAEISRETEICCNRLHIPEPSALD